MVKKNIKLPRGIADYLRVTIKAEIENLHEEDGYASTRLGKKLVALGITNTPLVTCDELWEVISKIA